MFYRAVIYFTTKQMKLHPILRGISSMKKLVISGVSVAVLSLGLALPLYAAEEAAAPAAAADAPKLEAKDGKCMAGDAEVTVSKNADGKFEAKDKDGKVVVTMDAEPEAAECKPKAE
jgi:hypothetical protein